MISSFCWVTIIISLMDDNVPRYRISCIQLRLIVIMYEDSGEIVSSQTNLHGKTKNIGSAVKTSLNSILSLSER